jgi:hypothetical protein
MLISIMKNKKNSSDIQSKPHTLLSSRNCWRSFKYIENKKGERFSPCRTPILHVYLKLFVLLYADDTVLFSDSASDLQLQLNIFCEYCNIWKLKVNS